MSTINVLDVEISIRTSIHPSIHLSDWLTHSYPAVRTHIIVVDSDLDRAVDVYVLQDKYVRGAIHGVCLPLRERGWRKKTSGAGQIARSGHNSLVPWNDQIVPCVNNLMIACWLLIIASTSHITCQLLLFKPYLFLVSGSRGTGTDCSARRTGSAKVKATYCVGASRKFSQPRGRTTDLRPTCSLCEQRGFPNKMYSSSCPFSPGVLCEDSVRTRGRGRVCVQLHQYSTSTRNKRVYLKKKDELTCPVQIFFLLHT